ncbi:MAG: agmatinase [Proteobacteria bacterium]|nr:agmatinase [Pseudomonadota bacterium]
MKQSRIEELKKKYSDRSPLEFENPEIVNFFERMLMENNFKHLVQSYSGMPTFLKTPYNPDLSQCDIALIGIPIDLGVVDRPGARFGPRSVREHSDLAAGPMHHVSGIIPFDLCRVADAGDIYFTHLYSLDSMIEEIYTHYRQVKSAGVVPLSIGGDHSATYPILKALGADRPLGLIHFDAHSDTTGEYGGSLYYNATPVRNAVLNGFVDPDRTIQIGIRGRCEIFWDFARDAGIKMIHAEECFDLGPDRILETIRETVGDGPTYITVDVDVFDPAYAPGTGEPEIGGLRPRDVQKIIRGLSGLSLVGGDVMEVSPPYDVSGVTARLAAQIMFEILCVLAESVAHGKKRS